MGLKVKLEYWRVYVSDFLLFLLLVFVFLPGYFDLCIYTLNTGSLNQPPALTIGLIMRDWGKTNYGLKSYTATAYLLEPLQLAKNILRFLFSFAFASLLYSSIIDRGRLLRCDFSGSFVMAFLAMLASGFLWFFASAVAESGVFEADATDWFRTFLGLLLLPHLYMAGAVYSIANTVGTMVQPYIGGWCTLVFLALLIAFPLTAGSFGWMLGDLTAFILLKPFTRKPQPTEEPYLQEYVDIHKTFNVNLESTKKHHTPSKTLTEEKPKPSFTFPTSTSLKKAGKAVKDLEESETSKEKKPKTSKEKESEGWEPAIGEKLVVWLEPDENGYGKPLLQNG